MPVSTDPDVSADFWPSSVAGFDPSHLDSRGIKLSTWETSKHVTWNTNHQPSVGDLSNEPIIVHKFGQSFVWSALHRAGSSLDPLRQVGDVLSDRVVDEIKPKPGADLLPRIEAAMQDNQGEASAAVRALANSLNQTPKWVDW